MPNISFEERQGASLLRRIIAGFWIILALGAGVAYVQLTPKAYQGSMEICYNEGSKGEVLSRVESILKEQNTSNITTDSVDKERLTVSCIAGKMSLVNSSLLMFQDTVKEAIRQDIESTYKAKKQEYDNKLKILNEKLGAITTKNSETEEYFQIITELEEGLKNRSMLPIGWEIMFEDNVRFRSILKELVANISAIEEINIELKTEASKMLVLSEWVNSPENQVVQISEKRVVYHEDSPELTALKDQKAAIEASRMRLLRRATTMHPTVIKMSEEIDELQAQINAMTRVPQVVEDIREVTNPRVSEFNSKILTTRGNIAALNSRLDTLSNKTLARLSDLRVLVNDAQKDKIIGREEKLKNELEQFQQSPATMDNSPIIGYVISNNIKRLEAPNLYLIYSLAGFAGIVGAILIMYSTKKSSFKLEEVEETPEFPVLGKIGKIGGSTITRS